MSLLRHAIDTMQLGFDNKLICVSSFTVWQLRTSYLSIIKDGIGDRLINVNNSVLNTPGFRAAGWLPTSANPTAQESGSLIKRTYSPPIPTTAAVASEYYQFARHTARELHDGDGLSIDDEDEGGMVTGGGGGSTYTFGVKHHGKSSRKNRRRYRQNQIAARPGQGEDEDSSDLSDESDDESEFTRYFSKLPAQCRNLMSAN
jgi:target of rapamycin complex 2 subunit MAPKAP1